MRQPIKVESHSVIDYGFAAVSLSVPSALGLNGAARAIPVAWGVGQGVLNALTDQPYALRRLVSFKRHGQAEAVALPALVATVAFLRPFEQRAAKPFLGALLAALVSNYALTDYDAEPAR
jgi:hypothetical protein